MQQIPLRNKDGDIIDHALVDDIDFDAVNAHVWHKTYYGYARRNPSKNESQELAWMHRFIWDLAGRNVSLDHLDHKDRNRLNNRRDNLREVTTLQNNLNREPSKTANKTGYLGVRLDSRDPKGLRYQVITSVGGRQKHICYMDSLRDAAIARDLYLTDLYPEEILRLNVPDPTPEEVIRIKQVMSSSKRHRNAASRYVGVYLDKRRNRWYSRHGAGSDKVFIGCFDTEIEAAHAFDNYCRTNQINRPLNFPL